VNDTPQRRAEASRWLRVAREDLRIAQACLDLDEPSLGGAAYHLQQAAEKTVKGLLVSAGTAFRRTHDLEELGALATPTVPHRRDLLERLAPATVWNAAYRYPSADEFADIPPTPAELIAIRDDIATLAAELEDRCRES
jgi:HEPN domain-containing protein